jgi:diguanylate cyclase (GGDEF)-like protein
MSSILLMGAIYAGELVIGIQSSINGISIGIDLFDLTEKYSSICLLITILSIRLYTTHNINLRILYESLLVCMIAQSIIDNNICIKVFLSFSHSMVLWDICVADLPVMLFVILVASNVDLTRWLKIPVHHLFTETATSSLPLILPIMTGFMALLLWKAQPHLVTASAVGVICITTYILQSFIRQIYTQRQLRAAQSEKVLLERIVQEDPVTGVYSRRWFDEMISLGCKDAKEGKPSIVVFMIDVDNFKGYNDTLGHKAGDYCLKAVAIALSGVQGRDRDAVARYGGDEMAAVLFQANVPGALAVAERMRQAVWGLNIPHPKNPHGRVTVSIGIGIAGATPGLITPADLVLAADAALYESKAQGKNTVTLKETRPYDGDVTTAMVMDSAPSQAVLGEASLRIEG